MAREQRLWNWMHAALKGDPLLHMRRVENRVSEGDPDVDGCVEGCYFELELKGCNRPSNPTTKLNFEIRQTQVLWHRRRWHAGGNLWLYIRVGQGRDVKRYLVPGMWTRLIKDKGITEEGLQYISVLPPEHSALDMLERVKLGRLR